MRFLGFYVEKWNLGIGSLGEDSDSECRDEFGFCLDCFEMKLSRQTRAEFFIYSARFSCSWNWVCGEVLEFVVAELLFSACFQTKLTGYVPVTPIFSNI